jgi:archaellum biogenesis protein FlaJ (TadC family)
VNPTKKRKDQLLLWLLFHNMKIYYRCVLVSVTFRYNIVTLFFFLLNSQLVARVTLVACKLVFGKKQLLVLLEQLKPTRLKSYLVIHKHVGSTQTNYWSLSVMLIRIFLDWISDKKKCFFLNIEM